MITQFLEDIDGLERLGIRPAQQCLNLRRGDKETVESELKLRQPTEYDMLVFNRNLKKNQLDRMSS